MPSGVEGVGIRRGAETTAPDAPAQTPTLPTPAEGTTLGRLPAIGVAPAPNPQPVAEAEAEARPQFDESLPAYLRYAAQAEFAPGDRALGVALLDAPGAEAALEALPMAVTIVLDPRDAEAPARAEMYLAAGHEVAILAAGIPATATASDVEVTWEVWRTAFPQIVAVMDAPANGVAVNRTAAQALAAALAQEGQGAISQRGGIDAFLSAARAEDVAAASIYRRLDGEGESLPTIRRLLDRAAFEAQRLPGILVLGNAANPDTLTALSDYVTSNARAGVVLTPVSAVLGTP